MFEKLPNLPTWSQILRRFLQVGSLLFIIYTAFGTPWRNYKMAYNNARLVAFTEGDFWATAYDMNDRMLNNFGDSAELSLSFLGMPWASTFFGLHSADPILVMGNIAATKTWSLSLLIALLFPLLLSVFFGRFFCSHICPARLVFELGEFAGKGLRRLGYKPIDRQIKMRLGGWVLLGGLIASFFGASVIWLFILPYVGLGASIYILVAQQTSTILILSMVLWLLVDMFYSKGFFCNNLCPTGFLLTWVGRFRIWRLATKENPEACPSNCRACERACPYNISSRDGAIDFGCDSCGRCVSSCPSKRLERRFTKPLLIALLAFTIPFGGTNDAYAHHNKGLPHYGYFENYPQTPTEEYVTINGNWEIGATIFNFQGYNLRESSDTPNDIKIYLYIYDLKQDKNYIGKARFEIRERGGDVVADFTREGVDEEAVYSTRERLPHTGDYEIVAYPEGVDEKIVLPFHIELQDGLNYTLIFGVGIPIVLLLSLAWKGRRRRKKTK